MKKFGDKIKSFPCRTTTEEFYNATFTCSFRSVFEENSHWITRFSCNTWFSRNIFERLRAYSKRFPFTPKRKAFSNSSGLITREFSWRISLDSTPNRRNKAVFSNFFSVVWTCERGENYQLSFNSASDSGQVSILNDGCFFSPDLSNPVFYFLISTGLWCRYREDRLLQRQQKGTSSTPWLHYDGQRSEVKDLQWPVNWLEELGRVPSELRLPLCSVS